VSEDDFTVSIREVAGTPRPGTRIAGRYRVDAVVGSGGFGVVLHAFDETLARSVALKLLEMPRIPHGDDSRVAAFLREARTIAGLDHPHVIPVYDAGVDGGRAFIAMRLVSGETLAARLLREKRLAPAAAVGIAATLARALAHAHRRGIVHRDVKPSNIMLEPGVSGDHPWLLDFGVARLLAEETGWRDRAVAGTPAYMAPEQVSGRLVDGRADLFGLGCVLFECLTGRRAFEGHDRSETAQAVIHDRPELDGEIAALAGGPVAAVLRRAMAKAPEDRWPDGESMAAALEQAIACPAGGDVAVPAAAAGLGSGLRRWWSARAAAAAAWDGVSAIECRDVAKGYAFRRPVLRGIELTVPTGAVFALLGRNASGKTTLVHAVLGLTRPDRGRVRVLGRDPARQRMTVIHRVGVVPDTLRGYEHQTVASLLAFLKRVYPKWDDTLSYELLRRFALPLETRLAALSRGSRTKVSLVAALSHRPDLLVLDDPTIGLDAVVIDEFFGTLREVARREGTTVLVCSHELSELESLATHVAFLSGGRIALSEKVDRLLSRTVHIELEFDGPVPEIPSVDGLHTISRSATATTLLATHPSAVDRVRALGPRRFQSTQPTLKEVFVALSRMP